MTVSTKTQHNFATPRWRALGPIGLLLAVGLLTSSGDARSAESHRPSSGLALPGASLAAPTTAVLKGGAGHLASPPPKQGSTSIPPGVFRPLFPGKDEAKEVPVARFKLDKHPVTNRAYARFLKAHPAWRKSQALSLFVDANYLEGWTADTRYPKGLDRAPVVNVSYFAAQAYCASVGGRLPSTAEWEYVAAASEKSRFGREEPAYNQRILSRYGRPTPDVHPDVMRARANAFGVHDMHGLVWEWTDDFNSVLVTGESRGDSGLERSLFCGSGSIGAADPSDYAAFMRTAFRSSLKGQYTGRNLGFRCAYD